MKKKSKGHNVSLNSKNLTKFEFMQHAQNVVKQHTSNTLKQMGITPEPKK